MATWPLKRMDQLCEITSSKRIFAADYVSEGVPFYRGREITEKYKGNLDVSTELFITEEKFSEIERKFGAPEPGDLLLTSVGTLGSVYVVERGDRFYFKDGNITWFRNFQALESRFLYYWLGSPKGKAELKKATIGSSQSAFTIVLLKGLEIELPPLPVQKRIAGILSAYDKLIENSQRRIRILEAMARALYREWFVHFRFPGHETHPRVAYPLGHIPKGWEVKKLDQLAEIKGGKQLEKEDIHEIGEFLVFGGNGIQGYSEKATHEGFVIAFGRVGAYCGSIHWSYGGAWLNNNSSSVVPLKHDELVLHYLLDFNFTNLRGGAAQPFISNTALAGIKLLFPGDALAEKFCSQVKPLRLQQVTLERQIQKLRRTRDLLLPRLLSGQV
jgi:type I restriction enzyme S subunit